MNGLIAGFEEEANLLIKGEKRGSCRDASLNAPEGSFSDYDRWIERLPSFPKYKRKASKIGGFPFMLVHNCQELIDLFPGAWGRDHVGIANMKAAYDFLARFNA